MKFRLSHAALEDLQSIDNYTVRTWGAEQADRYLAMLWDTFERIAGHPGRGGFARISIRIAASAIPAGTPSCTASVMGTSRSPASFTMPWISLPMPQIFSRMTSNRADLQRIALEGWNEFQKMR